jgi:uncharacterized protein (DUF2249 family)/quercetin dioxygenase-like cupin family protein
MTLPEETPMIDHELDVRAMRKPDKHPAIFRAYGELPAGGSLLLVNDHDPRHLHDEFEIEHPGGYAWDNVARDRGDWRIRITKLAATPLPRILADTAGIAGAAGGAAGTGAAAVLWKLQMRERDLDSNIIALAPGASIDAHAGPDVDVLIHVLAGSGQLVTELSTLELRAGTLAWLPRRSRRQFTAGPGGLRYLTVHQRRQALTLTPAAASSSR